MQLRSSRFFPSLWPRPRRLPKLYFLHVPKTAGTSLSSLLVETYRAEEEATLGPALLQDLFDPARPDWREVRLLLGHFARLPLVDARGFTAITLLREPHQHLLSMYEFIRRNPAHSMFDMVVNERLSFTAWLRDPRAHGVTDSYQARNLALVPDVSPLRSDETGSLQDRFQDAERPTDDRQLLRAAQETLESCAVAGTVDRIDTFVERLASHLRRQLPALPRLNTAPETRELTREERLAVAERAPVDLELYEWLHRQGR